MCSSIGCDIAYATVAWIFAAAACYLFLRRAIYNFADPFIEVNIAVPFSAALLTILCKTALVSWDKLVLFSVVLTAYLAGARTAISFMSRSRFRRAISQAVCRLSKLEVYTILTLAILVTLILSLLAIKAGAQGDARQDFGRAFRPLVTLQAGLFLFALLALLSPKLSAASTASWLICLVLLTIAFSGKAVFVPIFFWFGLKLFIQEKRIGLKVFALSAIGVALGIGLMGILAYGVSSSSGVLYLIATRLWLSGDVYIYAYQMDALSAIHGTYPVSFMSYMIHPLTSLIGIRGYEKPLGSMIASQVTGADVLTGPNPQLPVLLDYFFPDQVMLSIFIAFLVGILCLAIRVLGMRVAEGRGRYLALGGIAAAVFCPAAGFVDTSQVLIALVGIASVTICGSVAELITGKSTTASVSHDSHG